MIAWGWEEPWAYLVGEGNFITLIYCIQATMNVTSINLIPYLGCHFSKENWKMLYLFLFSHKGLKNRVAICILLMYLHSRISKGWILDERFNGGCVRVWSILSNVYVSHSRWYNIDTLDIRYFVNGPFCLKYTVHI